LEIGVFEGMSLCWMMQHVLTDPSSVSVGVDPWLPTIKLSLEYMEGVRERAHHNLRPWIEQNRCTLSRCSSAVALRKMLHRGYLGLHEGSVDICMIDGEHVPLLVCDDAKLVCRLLKPGGWMLFDDVEFSHPKAETVGEGIQMFLADNPPVRQVWKHGHMECYEKC
jgi:hypothetical protein